MYTPGSPEAAISIKPHAQVQAQPNKLTLTVPCLCTTAVYLKRKDDSPLPGERSIGSKKDVYAKDKSTSQRERVLCMYNRPFIAL